MESYGSLASVYDAFTEDVQYEKRADFVEKLLHKSGKAVHTVLDLACGTGTMTALFAARGYEMIGVDASEEMLLIAREKMQGAGGIPPLFLHQTMQKLDLYGTVDAAFCSLDSLNYLLRERDVRRTFERLHLFIAPGGALVFDVHGIAKMEAMDEQVFLDEREDAYCLWRTFYRRRSRMLDYEVDLFRRRGDVWERDFEEHHQRGYTVEELTAWLRAAGFADIRTFGDCRMRRAKPDEGRIYFYCVRK